MITIGWHYFTRMGNIVILQLISHTRVRFRVHFNLYISTKVSSCATIVA